MDNVKLTQEEQEIVEYIESSEVKSVPNVKEEMAKYTQMAKEHISKKKAISIRLPESDIYLLKQRALTTGISYQNIIQSLVHQYTHNQIKASL
jgi:predicted DNA binding CopG/RHH family protein